MLTIFTCPKRFDGHVGVIQRNALRSWSMLRPQCEILVLGSDDGVAEMAAEINGRHIGDVETNSNGVPLVSSVFSLAQKHATGDIVAYVNADIILEDGFQRAISQCCRLKRFFMIGRRWNINLDHPVDFGRPNWSTELIKEVKARSSKGADTAMDYFVFRRGMMMDIPPFALGRCAWDNWLVYRARSIGADVIDATNVIVAIHQAHDYGHTAEETQSGVWQGEDAQKNYALAGDGLYDLLDCNWSLTQKGLSRARSSESVARRMDRLQQFRPWLWRFLLSWKVRYAIAWAFPDL